MNYHVIHETTYAYHHPVSISHNLVHLIPRGCARQTLTRGDLSLSVSPAVSTNQLDFFGNPVTAFTIQEPHRVFTVRASTFVRVHPPALPDPAETTAWEEAVHRLRTERTDTSLDAYQFAFDSPYVSLGPALAEYAAPSFPPGRPIFEAVSDLTARIHAEFTFDPRATTIATPLDEVLRLRRGVCQDFAHLAIGCLRSLGMAARYVSGYLRTTPPPGQPRLVGVDASHAWLSVYCPRFGWLDIDPTNNMVPLEKHILVAWGRDYDDVSPVKGVILGGGAHALNVAVDVVAVDD